MTGKWNRRWKILSSRSCLSNNAALAQTHRAGRFSGQGSEIITQNLNEPSPQPQETPAKHGNSRIRRIYLQLMSLDSVYNGVRADRMP